MTATVSKTGFYQSVELASKELYVRALKVIPPDVVSAIDGALRRESNTTGKRILEGIVSNINKATDVDTLVCQDTGIPVYAVKVGRDLDVNLAELSLAIRNGCAGATKEYNLRPNLVNPLTRVNTGTNVGVGLPEIALDYEEGLGDNGGRSRSVEITALPKGSGSENCSTLRMLSPSDGLEGVKRFVLESIVQAGGRACPPLIVGVGIGGNFETVARIAKKAVFRPLGVRNGDPALAGLERELLSDINELGIGPMGLGGDTTALAVHVEYADTHISCLPVAVNTQCWRGERAGARVYQDGRIEYIDATG